MIDVVLAHTEELVEPVRMLFAEFADAGGADLTSKEFLIELAGLPGEYAPPKGRLVAGFEAAHLAGCAALRDAGGGDCEIRRLYVREEYRERGVERRLLNALLEEAGGLGYLAVRFDPRANQRDAEPIVRGIGFVAPPGGSGPCLKLGI